MDFEDHWLELDQSSESGELMASSKVLGVQTEMNSTFECCGTKPQVQEWLVNPNWVRYRVHIRNVTK